MEVKEHKTPAFDVRDENVVAASWTDPVYPQQAPYHPAVRYPEYDGPISKDPNGVYESVRSVLRDLGLDKSRYDTSKWNPVGELVPPGSRIVIKPNWVLHENEGPGGRDCLFTHPSVIRALIDYALIAKPSSLVIGDAPVQVCDLPALLDTGFNEVFDYIKSTGTEITVKDFRRTVSLRKPGSLDVQENVKPLEDYVLVDLGSKSLLEPISGDAKKFRVTMYDPRELLLNHGPGVHRYLVARDILDADLVINAPKLKTHMKAGVTLALKNLVGINGSKEFLPHHRKGAANRGGDNYEKSSIPKRLLENILDALNRNHLDKPRVYGRGARLAYKLLYFDKIRGKPVNVEGGWYGNDTVWRMCLDLNKILLFANRDGELQSSPQRMCLHVTDGIIAGDGEGPLRPNPINLGAITASINPAAHDWVTTRIMRLNPAVIPITKHAFSKEESGIANYYPDDITIISDHERMPIEKLVRLNPLTFKASAGWRGHCEL